MVIEVSETKCPKGKEEKMDFTGFVRSIQTVLMLAVGGMVFVTLLFLVIRRFFIPPSEVGIRETVTNTYWVLITSIAIAIVWYAVSVALTDRAPRSEVERSGIYKQVEGNVQR